MKICYLASAATIHSQRWIKYFNDAGHEILWISLVPRKYEIPGVEYHELSSSPLPLGLVRATIRLRKILRQWQPDVIHVHYIGIYGLLALLTGFRPIISTAWGSDILLTRNSIMKRLIIQTVLRRCVAVICATKHIRKIIMEYGVKSERIHRINFGVDVKQFHPYQQCSDIRKRLGIGDALVVISTRYFEPVYDIPTLLKAVPKVLKEHPCTHFILVGQGSCEAELKALSGNLGINKAVHFIGSIPNDEMPGYFTAADIYVSTSLSDGGIAASASEAMACGLPVIITDSASNSDWIEDGVNGFLFPTGDVEALATRLISLIESADSRKQIGTAGQHFIAKHNDYYHEMEKMNNIYIDIFLDRR